MSLFKSKHRKRVLVLGGDGMEATLVEKWAGQGLLPNLAKLGQQGTYSRMRTSNPAESPVAWSCFISGKNPGKHGIFDFLHRDPQTYLPKLAAVTATPRKFGKPDISCNRQGGSLWSALSEQKKRSVVFRVPVSFPPEEVRGCILSGLGIPDLRGTWGTSVLYATDADNLEATEMGGQVTKVVFSDGKVEVPVIGPKETQIPLTLQRNGNEVFIAYQGQKVTLKPRQWSPWLPIEFPINFFIKARGICRFFLHQAQPHLRLYLSPINLDPKKPILSIASPKGLTKGMVEEIGLFSTLGWAEDTWGLNEDRLDEDAFLEQTYDIWRDLEELTVNYIKKDNYDFFISVFEATDRIQHMFWRYIDTKNPLYDPAGAEKYGQEILKVYQRYDALVGKVLALVPPEVTVIAMSDHGFNAMRKAVNVNTWLVERGYLALKGERVAEDNKKLTDLFSGHKFWPNVDWTRSKAYALGLSKIYINLRGREALGTVYPGKEYIDLVNQIKTELEALRDPDNGEPVLKQVYRRNDLYSGQYIDQAGDLVMGFNPGYRTSWQTALGGIPAKAIEPNYKKWSADHCSLDPSVTPAVFYCNHPLQLEQAPHLMDMAPTILDFLGASQPEDFDGKSILK